MSFETLEREFFAALKPTALNIAVARERLEQMRAVGMHSALYTLYQARMTQRESFDNTGSSLRMILDEIVAQPIDDPVVYAKACACASNFALLVYNRQAIISLQNVTKRLWNDYSDCQDVVAWRPACELNIGMFYARIGHHAEAIACFNDMLAHFERTPANFCWLTQVHVNLALIHVADGNIDKAIAHLGHASETGMPYDEAERMLVAGRIAAATGDYESARTTLRKARDIAKRKDDRFTLMDVELALCAVYKAVENVDAFWYAHDSASQIAEDSGMTHVKDALALIRAGVPTT